MGVYVESSARRRERSDESLTRAAGLGDRQAFELIVNRHGPGMLAFARQLAGSDADAQDAVQEAFLAAWRNVGTFRFRSSLRTWLFSIVANKVKDLHRKKRIEVVDDQVWEVRAATAEHADPLEEVAYHDLLTALNHALAELPYHQRAAWFLREIEDMTFPQIARILAMQPSAVRGQFARARKNLSERMSRWR